MASRLVNVRLDEERLRKARRLRQRGVTLSELVREAIDARFDDLTAVTTAGGGRAIVARLLEEHPDPPDLPPRPYDVHDSREARAAIRRALRRRGR
jgi:post-segregation antitoxin (ccd killing protein)